MIHVHIHRSAVRVPALSFDSDGLRQMLHTEPFYTFMDACSNRKYIANACNNALLH